MKQNKNLKQMRIIGITGGIGTGKSTVLNLLKEKYHAYIVETDKLAHFLMEPGELAYVEIVKEFGDEILTKDLKIDRTKLGSIVFQDSEKLKSLNRIVHPAVKRFILSDIENKKEQCEISIYVIEAALLIEDGYKEICDEIWYIFVEKEERIKRLINGRGGSIEKWERIIANQSSDRFYKENSDYIIENMGSVENLENRIDELLYKK